MARKPESSLGWVRPDHTWLHARVCTGMNETWQVYVLECADGSLYTGVARNLERRLAQHNGLRAGGPKYTRGRRPVAVRWQEPAADRASAQQREAAIKRLSRNQKLALLES